MKRLFLVVIALCLLLSAAAAEGRMPQAVQRLHERAYPDYAVLAMDGYDDGTDGQWALVLTKKGHQVLLIAGREDGGEYAITLDNPAALPREGEGYSGETHTISVALTKEDRSDCRASLKITIGQAEVSQWVITSELLGDAKAWGNVISEYTTCDWDGKTIWWSHVFAQDGTMNYMRFQEDHAGKALSSAHYPRVPVAGEAAAAHLLECFDASAYPYMPDGMNGAHISAYAREYVPEGSALIQIDLQEDALILLVEGARGERTLRILPHENWQYRPVIVTKPLPRNASLDLYHADEGEIQIQWFDGAYEMQFGFEQKALGRWTAAWLQADGAEEGANYCFTSNSIGCREDMPSPARNDGERYGEHPWQTIQSIDFSAIPATKAEMLATLDERSYAFVSNPNPADRLHLREKPRKDARSFGKFYNRTPVKVHSIDGEWAHVSIGSLSGYMMVRYLAFGADKDGVKCAFPQETLREEIETIALKPYKNQGTPSMLNRDAPYYIVGVEEENYVILTKDGWTGYIHQSNFYPGNG